MIHQMSKPRYRWQEVTHDNLLDCIKWFLNHHTLQNWTIDLDTLINMPKEMKPGSDEEYVALCNIEKDEHYALLWVPIERVKEDNNNPIEACIHELCHVMIEDSNIDGDDEMLARRIAPSLYRLYCRDRRIKFAEKK